MTIEALTNLEDKYTFLQRTWAEKNKEFSTNVTHLNWRQSMLSQNANHQQIIVTSV